MIYKKKKKNTCWSNIQVYVRCGLLCSIRHETSTYIPVRCEVPSEYAPRTSYLGYPCLFVTTKLHSYTVFLPNLSPDTIEMPENRLAVISGYSIASVCFVLMCVNRDLVADYIPHSPIPQPPRSDRSVWAHSGKTSSLKGIVY